MSSGLETGLAICRFGHDLSLMLAFGVALFVWLLANKALRPVLGAQMRPLALAAAWIALASGIFEFLLVAASMEGAWSGALSPETLSNALTSTDFGPVWTAHIVLTASALLLLALQPTAGYAPAALASGAALVSLASTGHAGLPGGGLGALHRLNDAAHLLCAGAWLGSLPPFVTTLRLCRDPERKRDAVAALMRFSSVGHFLVAALFASGVANIALTTGFTSAVNLYRELLAAKILFALAMVGLALWNRYYVVARLRTSGPALDQLRVSALAEILLGVAVVALVAQFGILAPN